jgi:hypothetical protein
VLRPVFGTACPGVDVCGTARASGCDEQFVTQIGSIEMAEGRLLTNRNCAPTVRFVTSRTLRSVAHADRMVSNKPTSNCVGIFRKDDSTIFGKKQTDGITIWESY